MERATGSSVRAWRRGLVVLLAGLVLVALNLRGAITSVGPVIDDIRDDDGLSSTAIGLLTTAPVLAFGLVAPFGPPLARRFGMERVVLGCMLAVGAGLALRLPTPVASLFLGTVLAGCGIALANVLLPALVKRRFPDGAAFMTGVYSLALGVGASLCAGLTVPIAHWSGSWRVALAVWAIPAFLAALAWLPQVRGSEIPDRAEVAAHVPIHLWRDRIAWYVTALMALQSLLFYATVAWLPEVYRAAGLSAARAGGLLSLLLFVGIGGGFVIAVAAGRVRDQRALGATAVALTAIGLAGVLLVPTTLAELWAAVLGIGLGAGFTLTLTLMVLRARDARHAAELSGMAQSVGYTLAAGGPVVVGALHDLSGGWTVPLIVLLALTPAQLVAALGASRPGYVAEPATARPAPAATRPPAPE